MPKKRTKSGKNRIVRNPSDCITKRMPLEKDQTRDLSIAYRIALQMMLGGSGTEQAWSTLACALNVALLLSEQGLRPDAEPMIKLAQEGLMSIRRHAQTSGEWHMNIAFHLKQAILSAVNAHDEQCQVATKAQIITALREVNRRVLDNDVIC